MKKKRYWGLASFFILWLLATITVNVVAEGKTQVSFVTALWAAVAFYAIAGNLGAIATIAKIAAIIQVIVGMVAGLWLANDTSLQSIVGTLPEFVFSIGIPTILWIAVYYWARSRLEGLPSLSKEKTPYLTSDIAQITRPTPLEPSASANSPTGAQVGTDIPDAKTNAAIPTSAPHNHVSLGNRAQEDAPAYSRSSSKATELILVAVIAVVAVAAVVLLKEQDGAAPQEQLAQNESTQRVYLEVLGNEWVDGIMGTRASLRVLVKNTSKFTLGAPEIRAKMESCESNRTVIRLAQSQLNRLNFNSGEEDGILGRGTREAISNFQSSKGLEVTGALNGPTLAALRIDPSTDGFAPLGAGFIVGATSIKPGETVYVDFLNFYGQSRGRELCFHVSRDVTVKN